MVATSFAVMTASGSTLQKSAIFLFRSGPGTVRAAQQNVGLNADRPKFPDAVLRRLRLQLAGGADERHQREVNEQRVLAAHVLAHLPDRFEKRQRFDIADRTADLDDDHVGV